MTKQTDNVVAVDIGGTKILTALFDVDGKMLKNTFCLTLAGEGVNAVINRLVSAVKEISPPHISAVSIACAGGIDTARGVVVTPSPHLPGWENLPLAEIITEKTGVATYVLNDASAAALGEQRYGVGTGVKNLVLLTVGTGIGGGIIIDGKLYLGARGGAAELGHMTIEATGRECGCGNTGCFELYASGTALVNHVLEQIRGGKKSSLVDMAGGKLDKITAEMIDDAARRDDKLAQSAIARLAYYLGVGIVNIVNIFNPEMVVIGGGMAALGEVLIAPGRIMVEKRAFSINAQSVRIVIGSLGNEAGVYGAAAYALEKGRAK
ncbi:MAG: ROK family protein [Dehalococcoidales bacterium]|nr:ROK family protein [Dehalococcoidales bacterium]